MVLEPETVMVCLSCGAQALSSSVAQASAIRLRPII
jgi:hypothetical protein